MMFSELASSISSLSTDEGPAQPTSTPRAKGQHQLASMKSNFMTRSSLSPIRDSSYSKERMAQAKKDDTATPPAEHQNDRSISRIRRSIASNREAFNSTDNLTQSGKDKGACYNQQPNIRRSRSKRSQSTLSNRERSRSSDNLRKKRQSDKDKGACYNQ